MAMSDDIIAAHNKYRAAVGSPPIQWSNALAQGAQSWADHLVADVHGLEHSQTGDEGENLAAQSKGLPVAAMVDAWASEQEHFVNGTFPDVSDSGQRLTRTQWEGRRG